MFSAWRTRPEIVLRHPRTHRAPHLPHGVLARDHRAAHGVDFVRILDLARVLGDALPVPDVDPEPVEGPHPRDLHLVDGETPVPAAVRTQKLVDLAREATRHLVGAIAGRKVEEGPEGPSLVDQRQVVGEVDRPPELEEDDGAVGRDEAGPRRVVGDPHLHVGRVGRVADVERVEEEEPRAVVAAEFAAQPFEPVLAEGGEVRHPHSRLHPLPEGERGGADLDAVVVVRGAVRPAPWSARVGEVTPGGPPAGTNLRFRDRVGAHRANPSPCDEMAIPRGACRAPPASGCPRRPASSRWCRRCRGPCRGPSA